MCWCCWSIGRGERVSAKVTKIQFNSAGFQTILRSPRVLAELHRRGVAIAAAAHDGVGVEATVGANRARVTVMTETREAMEAEATDKVLTSAIGAGRG